MKHLLCALISTTAFACAPDGPTTIGDEPLATDEAAAPQNPAVDTLLGGGNFRFALADSEVFGDMKASCATEVDPAACLQRIQDAAAGEGIQITPQGGNRVRYLSYVHEGFVQATHLEAELTVIKTDEPSVVELVDAKLIEGRPLPEGARILIEVLDDDTIAMDKSLGHPRTGGHKLVFHRGTK